MTSQHAQTGLENLIAASQALLSESETLIGWLKGMAIHPSHYARLEAAVAKAKATSPTVVHLPSDDTEGGAV